MQPDPLIMVIWIGMRDNAIRIEDVEAWNDEFAREHDIDEYYFHSSHLIKFIEQRRLRCIKKMVSAQPGDSILEVGCGGGHVLQQFAGASLTGVDVSSCQLKKAEKNLKGFQVKLLKGELHTLGLENSSFDKIICSEVLEHSLNPEEILIEIRRLLRPGGVAVITFPNDRLINSVKKTIRALRADWLFPRMAWGGDVYHLHQWSIEEMGQLLSEFFRISQQGFAPYRAFPIRCCFRCELK